MGVASHIASCESHCELRVASHIASYELICELQITLHSKVR